MAKRARKTKNQQHQQGEVINLTNYRKRERSVTILPKNLRQEDYLDLLDNDSKNIVLAMGPAGTGKTLLAVLAAIRAFKTGECEKIVVTRPAVSVDEQHGFLPGTLVEKMAPWTRPIFDVFEEYWSPQQIEGMVEDGCIEIAPLAYMRGRTFKNAWILADEMQNATLVDAGYKFQVITSLSLDKYAKKARVKNLQNIFGKDVFTNENVVCLDTGADKDEALAKYAETGMYWVEDKVENAELGAKLGLTCLLINHGHNQTCNNTNIKRVANWADVVSIITS